jgi:TRAP-type transport system small permease protein
MTAHLARLEFVLGTALMSAIVVLVFIAAVMRFAGHPIIWSVDMAQLLFIWLCFLGAAKALRAKAHLGVDLFVRLLPQKNRLALELLLAFVCLVFLTLLFFEGIDLTLLNRERLFGDSGLSYAYVTIAVPAGSVLLSLAILNNMVGAWKKRDEGMLVFSRSNSSTSGGEL